MDAPDQPTDPADPRLGGHPVGSGVVEMQVCNVSDANGVAGVTPGPTGISRFVVNGVPADPSPATLAQQASDSFLLPSPVWGRFPAFTLADGRPYTVVKTHMWFWTDAASWKPLSARAQAGANWAQVTATPVALGLIPGDGAGEVWCAAPGRPFDPVRDAYPASWVPQPEPDGCDYTYPRSTRGYPAEMLTATLQIRWELAWSGSGGTSGTLTSRTTSTDSTFMVAEAQAVVAG